MTVVIGYLGQELPVYKSKDLEKGTYKIKGNSFSIHTPLTI
jgi:hypothetical protein